jgi:SPP1 family predicted phage head-tail adaptor
MNPGKLRNRITIQKLNDTIKDEYNRPTTDWDDFATVWAAVEPLKGREYLLAQNTNTELTVRIRIRYLPGITPGMRVKYGERIFDIQSVIDIEERHREMHLMCVEVNR